VKLLDSSNHYTHFTGFMLEEEIVASLWVPIIRNAQNAITWQQNTWLAADDWQSFCKIIIGLY
jgi:hypothetical protein